MSFRHGTFIIQLFSAIALLCFCGRGAALALEHSGVIEMHAHEDWQTDDSDAPNGDGPAHSGLHHHLADIVSPVLEKTFRPLVSASPFVVPDELCHEGPVFGIDYPPQLS